MKSNCYLYSWRRFQEEGTGCIALMHSKRSPRRSVGLFRKTIGETMLYLLVVFYSIAWWIRFGGWIHTEFGHSQEGPWEAWRPSQGKMSRGEKVSMWYLLTHILHEGRGVIKTGSRPEK